MPSYPPPLSLEEANQKKRRLLAEIDQLTVKRRSDRPDDAKEAIVWEQRLIEQKAALTDEVRFLTEWLLQASRARADVVSNLKAENAALKAEAEKLRAEMESLRAEQGKK